MSNYSKIILLAKIEVDLQLRKDIICFKKGGSWIANQFFLCALFKSKHPMFIYRTKLRYLQARQLYLVRRN